MSHNQSTSVRAANILIVLVLALRAVDLIPPLAHALQPFFPAYAATVIISVLAVLVLERRRLDKIFISRHGWREALVWGLSFGSLLGFFNGMLLAWMRFGVHWLPWNDVLPTLGAALATAFFEELMFRSYALSRLAETRLGPVWANIIQTVLFVAVHPRYFAEGNWLMVVSLTAFALATGALTLRTRNVLGAMAAHAGLDFMVFVAIGGAVARL